MAKSNEENRRDTLSPSSPNTTKTKLSDTHSDDTSSSSSSHSTTSSARSSSSPSMKHSMGRRKHSQSKQKRKKEKKRRSKKRSDKSKSTLDVGELLQQNAMLVKQLSKLTSMNTKLASALNKNQKRESDDTVSSDPHSSNNKKHKSDGSTIASHDNDSHRYSSNKNPKSWDLHPNNNAWNPRNASSGWRNESSWHEKTSSQWSNKSPNDFNRYSSNKNNDWGHTYGPNLSRYVAPRFRSEYDRQSGYRSKTDVHFNEPNKKKEKQNDVPEIIYIWAKKSSKKIRNDVKYGLKTSKVKLKSWDDEKKQEFCDLCIKLVKESKSIMGKRDIQKKLLETFPGYSNIFEDDNPLLSKIKESIKQRLLDIPIQTKVQLGKDGKLLPSSLRDLSHWEPSQSDFESDNSSLSEFQKRNEKIDKDCNSNNTYGYYRFKYKVAHPKTATLKSCHRYDSSKPTFYLDNIPKKYLNKSKAVNVDSITFASKALSDLANRQKIPTELYININQDKAQGDATVASPTVKLDVINKEKHLVVVNQMKSEVGTTVAPTSDKSASVDVVKKDIQPTKAKTEGDAIVASPSLQNIPSLEELKRFNFSTVRINIEKPSNQFRSLEEYHKNILEDYQLWFESDFDLKLSYYKKECQPISEERCVVAVLHSLKRIVPIIQEQVLNSMGYYELDESDDDVTIDCNPQMDGSDDGTESYHSETSLVKPKFVAEYYYTEVNEKVSNIKNFLCKLRSNTVYDLMLQIAMKSRNVTDINTRHCFCPCSRNMKNWRSSNDIEEDVYFTDHETQEEYIRCRRNSFIASGLLSHLWSTKCLLHKAIYYYMYSLYGGKTNKVFVWPNHPTPLNA